MKRTTRASFSGNPPTVNVKLPTSWAELSQVELHDVYRIISQCIPIGIESVYFALFRYFAKVKVISRDHDTFLCRFTCKEGRNTRRVLCRVTPGQLAELLEPLSFIHEPGSYPVRLDNWHGGRAIDACFHGLSFGDYIQLENMYQGFLTSNDASIIPKFASLLYPGVKSKYIDDLFIFNILQWMVQVKALFARQWPNFFKPASGGGEPPSMLEVMNNEIRALTGGDVTKEDVIFATDCWRALTELDFKAKEAEDLKRQMSKTKH